MKTKLLHGILAITAASALAGQTNQHWTYIDVATNTTREDVVTAAARKLGQQPNYSWRTTTVVPDDSPFHPGPTDGATEKSGFTLVKMDFGFDGSITEMVLKGDKSVIRGSEGGWQTAADLENAEGPARFLLMIMRNFKAPAEQAAEIAGFVKELKKDGDLYSGDLTEEGARTLILWRRRGGGDEGGPAVANPKGSAKFWMKDGVLSKYEFQLKGTVSWNGNDWPADRTSTTEIKDVGTTKVQPPDEAKKKIS